MNVIKNTEMHLCHSTQNILLERNSYNYIGDCNLFMARIYGRNLYSEFMNILYDNNWRFVSCSTLYRRAVVLDKENNT